MQLQSAWSADINYWPLCILLLLAAIGFVWSWRRKQAWRQQAHRCLQQISRQAAQGEWQQAWSELAWLLRRLALHARPGKSPAGLTGESWLALLDELFQTREFSNGCGRGLLVYPYQPATLNLQSPCAQPAIELEAALAIVNSRLSRLRVVESVNGGNASAKTVDRQPSRA